MRYDAVADILAGAIGLNPASLGEKALMRAARSEMVRLGLSPRSGAFGPGGGNGESGESGDPGEERALAAYVRLLRTDAEVLTALIHEIVVPETWFFRDDEAFVRLGAKAAEMKRQGRSPRILSAPCATGEEVYSIAMTCLAAGFGQGEFSVLGADVSAECLDAARKAVYGPNSFRGEIGPYARYFSSRTQDAAPNGGAGDLRAVAPEAARAARFIRANIVSPDFLAAERPFDVIFSRNLLIYLTDEARRRLADNIRRLLVPDGLLFAGHAEAAYFISKGFTADPHPRSFACRPASSVIGTGAGAAARSSHTQAASVSKSAAWKTPRPSGAAPGPGRAAPGSAFAAPFLPAPRPRAEVPQVIQVPPPPLAAPKDAAPSGTDLLAEARVLADRGELSQAEALCRKRLAASPQCAGAYALLGLIALAGGDQEEAGRRFQKALYLDPAQRDSLAHLSALLEARGEKSRAEILRRRFERIENSERSA